MSRKKKSGKKSTVRRSAAKTSGKKSSRRKKSSNKVQLSFAGLKKVADLQHVMYAAAGAIAARGVYGYASERYGAQTDANIIKLVASVLPIVAAIAISGKKTVASAVAAGALGILAVDVFGNDIATYVARQSPGAASAIATGMGGAGYYPSQPAQTQVQQGTLTGIGQTQMIQLRRRFANRGYANLS